MPGKGCVRGRKEWNVAGFEKANVVILCQESCEKGGVNPSYSNQKNGKGTNKDGQDEEEQDGQDDTRREKGDGDDKRKRAAEKDEQSGEEEQKEGWQEQDKDDEAEDNEDKEAVKGAPKLSAMKLWQPCTKQDLAESGGVENTNISLYEAMGLLASD
ncbi:hypothetical protein AC578_2850 [Pseudocercospora eumusae]|uniref:Uncharacterized protein n=1 Tax=Pseudocercospora eumusae TaxID=321146 RepID=A0A139H4E0_9PEZI|nr:hypothetical protein AC578_2850 [Pseudocercospora eumusae]